jgi:ActR/RegA family two-component response regulator
MSATLLIVDDEAPITSTLSRIATRVIPSFRVLTAGNPNEALGILAGAGDHPLFVLADFNMGCSENGLDFLEEVRRRRPDARRYLMSGYAEEDLRREPNFDAAEGFLAKPANTSALREFFGRFGGADSTCVGDI